VYGIIAAARRPALRPVAFGLAWFALGLLPSSSVFPLAETANEHRVFLPYIGLMLAAGWVVVRILSTRTARNAERAHEFGRTALIAGTLVIAALAVSSSIRNRVWKTERGFWADIVEKSPRNARALMNFGSLLLREGDDRGALERFERAHAMAPNYAILEINLGIVSGRLGDTAAAERHYLRALELQPNSAESHFYYAHWLTGRGKARDAEEHLREAIRISPATVDARHLLMNLSYAAGNDAALDSLATSTLAISPGDSIALAYANGRVPVAASPDNGDGYFVRGLGLMQENDYVLAGVAYRRALILSGENPDVINNLGWARAKLGYYGLAAPAFERALQLRPDYPLAQNNLAWVRSQLAGR
jgi:Flp pilus assembly protein TadD